MIQKYTSGFFIALFIGVSTLFPLSVSQADEDETYEYGGMMGPGMMGPSMMGPGMMRGMGPGMMGGMGPCPYSGGYGMGYGRGMQGYGGFAMLDLSADQRKKMREISNNLRQEQRNLRDKIEDQSYGLTELYDMETPDPGKISEVYKTIFDLQRQMIESQIKAHNQKYQLLTAEQKETLKKRGPGIGKGYRDGYMQGMPHMYR